MTIEDVRAFDPEVVAIGIGSVEPHGPVLPYGTDYWQCDAVARRGVQLANEQGARALMYPTLPVGNNGNFKAFPLACRIGVQTLMQVILDIIASLSEDGIKKIVLINGHGGNTDALQAALRANVDSRRPGESPFVCMVSYPASPSSIIEDASDHGGGIGSIQNALSSGRPGSKGQIRPVSLGRGTGNGSAGRRGRLFRQTLAYSRTGIGRR